VEITWAALASVCAAWNSPSVGKDEEEARAFEVDQAAEPEDDPSLVLPGDPDAGEHH
jgi:hypothetical protein